MRVNTIKDILRKFGHMVRMQGERITKYILQQNGRMKGQKK